MTTIEGLAAQDGTLHPVQQAFHEKHALQCGFCTPGMIMQSVALLAENPDPSEQEIREGLEGNLCRCTGYQNIVAAVQAAPPTVPIGRAAPPSRGRRAGPVTTVEDAPAAGARSARSAPRAAARRTRT